MTTTEDGLGVPAAARGVTTPGEGAAQAGPHPEAAPPLTEDGFFVRSRAGHQQRLPQVFAGRMDEVLEPESVPEPPTGIQIPPAAFRAAPEATAASE
jgi:hypothetical protein